MSGMLSQCPPPLLHETTNHNHTILDGKRDDSHDKPSPGPTHTLTLLSNNYVHKGERAGHKKLTRKLRCHHLTPLHTNKPSSGTAHHRPPTTLPQTTSLQVRTTSVARPQVAWPALLTMLQNETPGPVASRPCRRPTIHNRPTSTSRPHRPMLETDTCGQRPWLMPAPATHQGTGTLRPAFNS